jgi:glycine/D-amino acid oxidase-like deaminating enzyme
MQIVGPVPAVNGLVLAAGFSGHGFGIGPGVGSLIARYITTDTLPEMLKPYSIDRFAGNAEEDRNEH